MNRQIKSIQTSDDSVENIKHLFASDCTISSVEHRVSDQNLFHARLDVPITPRLCVWKLLTPEGIASVKRCFDDETAIKHLIGKQLRIESPLLNDSSRNIFLELAWSIVRFASDNRFTEEGTSALIGIFHLTYSFFLTYSWLTAEETYMFFYKTTLLHAVENPPKTIEIFTPEECRMSIEFFLTILVKHLHLVRFACVPNYRCIQSIPKQD